MRDAMTVSDNYRRPIICVSFHKGIQCLLIAGTHGNFGYIDIPISHCDHSEVFFRNGFALGCEASDRCARCRFGCLPTRVGINFGIQNQEVYISSTCQDMIQTAVANIIRPAIPSHDPYAFTYQHIHQAKQISGFRVIDAS